MNTNAANNSFTCSGQVRVEELIKFDIPPIRFFFFLSWIRR